MQLSKNFTSEEFECSCGCGANHIAPELVVMLQELRDLVGDAINVTSGVRCVDWNKQVGGSPTSSHVRGLAVDIHCESSESRYVLVYSALEAGFIRIGVGSRFVHLDIDPTKAPCVIWTY